jgi:hypothetical protein
VNVVPHQDIRVQMTTVRGRMLLEQREIALAIGVVSEAKGPVHAALDDMPGATGQSQACVSWHGMAWSSGLPHTTVDTAKR